MQCWAQTTLIVVIPRLRFFIILNLKNVKNEQEVKLKICSTSSIFSGI